jgi:hypothetical protein
MADTGVVAGARLTDWV